MILVTKGILELLTAIFIDSLITEKHNADIKKAMAQVNMKSELESLILGLFETFDTDHDGSLTADEVEGVIDFTNTPDVSKVLSVLEIDHETLATSLRMADIDGDGGASKAEVSEALRKLTDDQPGRETRLLNDRLSEVLDRMNALEARSEEMRDMRTEQATIKDLLANISLMQEHIMERLGPPSAEMSSPKFF